MNQPKIYIHSIPVPGKPFCSRDIKVIEYSEYEAIQKEYKAQEVRIKTLVESFNALSAKNDYLQSAVNSSQKAYIEISKSLTEMRARVYTEANEDITKLQKQVEFWKVKSKQWKELFRDEFIKNFKAAP